MATRFVTVSIDIMHDKNLNQSQKFLLAEIEQLSQLNSGCIATNEHFSHLIGISKVNVSRNISSLEKMGYINTEIQKGTRNHIRIISLIKLIRPPYQNDKTPLSKRQESKENKTINKTINKEEIVKAEALDDSQVVANYLYLKIKENNPTYKKPSLSAWIKDIELAIRVDNRTKTELINCINWIYNTSKGSFWIPNILSGKKLRQKFDTMNMQSKAISKQESKTTMVDTIYSQGTTASELIKRMEQVS